MSLGGLYQICAAIYRAVHDALSKKRSSCGSDRCSLTRMLINIGLTGIGGAATVAVGTQCSILQGILFPYKRVLAASICSAVVGVECQLFAVPKCSGAVQCKPETYVQLGVIYCYSGPIAMLLGNVAYWAYWYCIHKEVPEEVDFSDYWSQTGRLVRAVSLGVAVELAILVMLMHGLYQCYRGCVRVFQGEISEQQATVPETTIGSTVIFSDLERGQQSMVVAAEQPQVAQDARFAQHFAMSG